MNTPQRTAVVSLIAVGALSAWWFLWRRHVERNRLSVEVSCECGKVRLEIDATAPVHLVCYCDDCQGYAEWLAQRKNAAISTVDVQGGSRTCQVFKSNVKVVQGVGMLQCTALDPKLVPSDRPQQMLRVHAGCCFTPLISACWRELPTIGFYAANVVIDENENVTEFFSVDPQSGCWSNKSTNAFPPPEYRINTRWARSVPGMAPPRGDEGFPVRFLLRFICRNFLPRPGCQRPCPWPLPSPGGEEIR